MGRNLDLRLWSVMLQELELPAVCFSRGARSSVTQHRLNNTPENLLDALSCSHPVPKSPRLQAGFPPKMSL